MVCVGLERKYLRATARYETTVYTLLFELIMIMSCKLFILQFLIWQTAAGICFEGWFVERGSSNSEMGVAVWYSLQQLDKSRSLWEPAATSATTVSVCTHSLPEGERQKVVHCRFNCLATNARMRAQKNTNRISV